MALCIEAARVRWEVLIGPNCFCGG
jgi:hypothetical protein